MGQQLAAFVSVLCATVVGAWTLLLKLFRALVAIDDRTYRPEKYYMRGPGPRWREKRARSHDPALG